MLGPGDRLGLQIDRNGAGSEVKVISSRLVNMPVTAERDLGSVEHLLASMAVVGSRK